MKRKKGGRRVCHSPDRQTFGRSFSEEKRGTGTGFHPFVWRGLSPADDKMSSPPSLLRFNYRSEDVRTDTSVAIRKTGEGDSA
ncbi:hypothetical protein CDAR_168351 [Caerostris darwini]|uniref:Uncharacterized protein n=1 Tax=Caerostris darwini TaxID=1538125 RepID=A0AAV4T3V4_9ARAC|nr:hypothetical protein CDAR_168351 [Caerostris darwini]